MPNKGRNKIIFLLLGFFWGTVVLFDEYIYAYAGVYTSRGTFQGGAAVNTSSDNSSADDSDSIDDTQTEPETTYQDSETVKKVQEELNNIGYECGTVDGIAGDKTQSAIQQYQEDKGLTISGVINDELLESLELNNLLVTDTKLSREIALRLYCIGKPKETIEQFVDFGSAEIASDETGTFYTFRDADLSVYYDEIVGDGTETWHFEENNNLDRIFVVFEHESDPNFIESARCLEETVGPYEEIRDQEAGTVYYLWHSLQSVEIIEYYNFIGSDSSKDDGIMELTIEYCKKE